jgi:hypothetical protein
MLKKVGAHARANNSCSIGIACEGGLNTLGFPSDTRTLNQRISLQLLVASFKEVFPGVRVAGHRDLSFDLEDTGTGLTRQSSKEKERI